ncbi:uncharacterized protein LOC125045757 [Penaeus chinensis]|uniref:uncharacterized protein LOC125045757 n=1 Tax=Penaeus chinensis TaxID=139456 RepID=UPI001FB79EA1|nr:uncharacterized protein LOC125045757 [Penaeus chinensis]
MFEVCYFEVGTDPSAGLCERTSDTFYTMQGLGECKAYIADVAALSPSGMQSANLEFYGVTLCDGLPRVGGRGGGGGADSSLSFIPQRTSVALTWPQTDATSFQVCYSEVGWTRDHQACERTSSTSYEILGLHPCQAYATEVTSLDPTGRKRRQERSYAVTLCSGMS